MKEEIEMLSNELALRFNLNTCLRLNKNKHIIVIKHDSYKTFINFTNSYIIPWMRYKLAS